MYKYKRRIHKHKIVAQMFKNSLMIVKTPKEIKTTKLVFKYSFAALWKLAYSKKK